MQDWTQHGATYPRVAYRGNKNVNLLPVGIHRNAGALCADACKLKITSLRSLPTIANARRTAIVNVNVHLQTNAQKKNNM